MIVPKNSYLRLRCIGDSTYTVRAKVTIRRPDGRTDLKTLSTTITSANSLKDELDTTQIGSGVITDATIEHTEATTYLRPGQLYATLSVLQALELGGFASQHMLCGGPIAPAISRPFFEPPLPYVRTILPSDPAAGANLNYTLPDSLACDELVSVACQMVTDANVATRRAVLAGRDGADLWAALASTTQAASLTRLYRWNAINTTGILNTEIFSDFHGGGFVPNAGRIDIRFDNIQAGDQLSAVKLTGKWRWVFEGW